MLTEEEAEIRRAKIIAAATERQIEEMRRDNERYHQSTARECLVNEDTDPRSLIPRRRVPSEIEGWPSCSDLYTGAQTLGATTMIFIKDIVGPNVFSGPQGL